MRFYLRFLVGAAALVASMAIASAAKGSLGNVVVVGDSLSAGFQNGLLVDFQQPNGYASLVVNQAVKVHEANAPLVLPLVLPPGIGPALPPQVQPGPRQNPMIQATDLAVPGQTLGNALTLPPDPMSTPGFPFSANPIQTLTNYVLGYPGTLPYPQVKVAQKLNPDTVIVWLGANDVLGYFEGLTTCDNPCYTSIPDFQKQYTALITAFPGRQLIVANIPDVTLTPFMQGLLASGAINEAVIEETRMFVQQYNQIISTLAAQYHVPVVDTYTLLNNLAANGYKAGPDRLTTAFGGGIFSCDGIHPTNTGYAIIANTFIDALNDAFNTHIPQVNVVQVAKSDPLIVPGVCQALQAASTAGK